MCRIMDTPYEGAWAVAFCPVHSNFRRGFGAAGRRHGCAPPVSATD